MEKLLIRRLNFVIFVLQMCSYQNYYYYVHHKMSYRSVNKSNIKYLSNNALVLAEY